MRVGVQYKVKCSAKFQHLIWLCLHSKLRHHYNIANSLTCNKCTGCDEDIIHCLRDCKNSREVWNHFSSFDKQHFFSFTCVQSWIKAYTSKGSGSLFSISLWLIWRLLNEHALGEGCCRPTYVVRFINRMHEDMSNLKLTTTHHHIHRDSIQWEPPPEGFVKLNVDGSCSAADDIGVGGAIMASGLLGFLFGVGDALFVELFGVYNGLALVVNNTLSVVVCETDSEEVIQLVKNRDQHCFHAYASLRCELLL